MSAGSRKRTEDSLLGERAEARRITNLSVSMDAEQRAVIERCAAALKERGVRDRSGHKMTVSALVREATLDWVAREEGRGLGGGAPGERLLVKRLEARAADLERDLAVARAQAARREREISDRQAELDVREAELDVREAELDVREAELDVREAELLAATGADD